MNIVYEHVNGTIAIATVVDGADISEVVRKFREAHPGSYPKFTVHEHLEMPGTRENRDSWRLKGDKVISTN